MKVRLYLKILLIVLTIVQAAIMVRWVSLWGFWGGIAHWFQTFTDPILLAAGIDLIAFAMMIGGCMYLREGRWNKTLTLILLPYILFPSLGFLLYLIISEKNLPGESLREP